MPREDVLPQLHPRLVVKDAAAAIDFYVQALAAVEIDRFTAPNGMVVHAGLKIGSITLALVDEDRPHGNHAPPSLGGSPVLLYLQVEDADASAAKLVAAGATVLVPIADQFYGRREGRLQDPFGHVWIISQFLQDLSVDEVQRRVDAFPSEIA